MQKHVNLVDLVKSFPTNILLQNLASIQQRTSPLKFAHLAEKSEKNSISNLSTKAGAAVAARAVAVAAAHRQIDEKNIRGWDHTWRGRHISATKEITSVRRWDHTWRARHILTTAGTIRKSNL